MKTVSGLTTTALCIVLSGCSEPATAPQPTAQPTAPVATAVSVTPDNQGVLTDNQRAGLNSATEVSDMLKQADEARRKQLDAPGL